MCTYLRIKENKMWLNLTIMRETLLSELCIWVYYSTNFKQEAWKNRTDKSVRWEYTFSIGLFEKLRKSTLVISIAFVNRVELK